MTYTSVTTWQAEQYQVDIHFGFFGTVADAAAMASTGIKKIFLDGLGMWVGLNDGTASPVRPDGIFVRRILPCAVEASKHRALTLDDFESVQMSLDDMRRDPDMRRGFGSLAYGVVDADGKAVALPQSH